MPIEYLDLPDNEISLAIYSNARQMAAQFKEKERRTKQNTWSILYSPFTKLNVDILETYFNQADVAYKHANYLEAVSDLYRVFSRTLYIVK